MAVKRLLVHLDDTPSVDARIEAAVGLAERLGASVVGFFAITGADRRAAPGAGAGAEAALRTSAASANVPMTFYEALANRYPETNNTLIVAARHCDMTVVGQRDPDRIGGSVPDNLVEQMVTRAGRPVLIIPYAGRFPELGRRVVIAWNGSREAARTVQDALPILAGAEHVTVLSLHPGAEERPAMPPGLAELGVYLQAHGITATPARITVDRDQIEPADAFLSYLADTSADLAVIGAGGESGNRGWSRRSLTGAILDNMTTPLLISS